MAIRNEGDWEGWIKFFLRGVFEVSQGATDTARAILDLRETHRRLIAAKATARTTALRILDLLFQQPIVVVNLICEQLGCSYVTAANALEGLRKLKIVREVTGARRNRRYSYDDYLALFERQVLRSPADDRPEPIKLTRP